jgi:ABC-type transporter Mla maintaining outer membrane lipid asymmetry permease subunit MlaE
MHLIGRLGAEVWAQWDELRHTAAVIGTVLCVCVQPQHWVRTGRKAFARQVLSIGVEPLWFVGAVAVFVGISVVVQLTFWVGEAGQSLPAASSSSCVRIHQRIRRTVLRTEVQAKSVLPGNFQNAR